MAIRIPSADPSALDHALALARENYVRRNPCSLARHIVVVAAAAATRPRPSVPFALVITVQPDGRIATADGDSVIDCRGDGMIAAFAGDAPATRAAGKLRALFYLDLLAAGLLVGEDAGLAVPPTSREAGILQAAVIDFLRRRGGLF